MNKAIKAIKEAAQNMASKVGVTSQFTANLGKGDGTGTIIYADDLSRRLVWCHEPGETGGSRKVFLAVLGEGAGIPFMNDPRMEGMEVRIGYPPGASQMHILGMAVSAYYGTSGQTVQDQVTQTAIRPPADAIITLRVEATYPNSTSISVGGPFLFIRPSDWAWRSFSGGIYDLNSRINALTSGQHQLCLICLDPETSTLVDLVNTASSATDTLPQRASFGLADVLGFTIRNYIPLGAIYLYYGQNTNGISESDIYRSYPTRFMFQPAGLNKFNATAAPGVGDDANDGYTVGSRWIDTTNDVTYVCVDSTVGAAVWKQTSNATNTDEKAKVSSNDTTAGYLNGKLVAGSNITLTENNDGGNETLTIAASASAGDEKAKVSSNDTTAGYLNGKLVAGSGISLTENNDGGNETLTIAATASAATVYVQTNGGRLTLTSGTPVTTSDVTAAGTLYWTPYKHNQIALYDGSSAWSILTFSELSLSLSGFTNALPYDIWVYNNSGTAALDSTAWTNTTTRATALTTVNGVYCKSGATTRRYLGTIYMSATSQTEDSAAKRFVWNYYNRELRYQRKYDATSHTYNSTTVRYWNNSSSNIVECVVGVVEGYIMGQIESGVNGSSALNGAFTGFNINANNAYSDTSHMPAQSVTTNATTQVFGPVTHTYPLVPIVGYNYIAALESAGGAAAPTYQRFNLKAWHLC